MDSLWENDNLKADRNCLIGQVLYDYDIHHANISILHNLGVLSDKTFDYLKHMPKQDREYYIGNLIRKNNEYIDKNNLDESKSISNILSNGFKVARKLFITKNELTRTDILEIRKDSIMTLRPVKNRKFGEVEFLLKNRYTSFYKVLNFEFFLGISIDIKDTSKYLEIKGISDSNLIYHNEFSNLLKTIFITAEKTSNFEMVNMMKNIIHQYVNMEFPINIYREFNSNSKFALFQYGNDGNVLDRIGVDFIQYDQINQLDISYNFNILKEIYKIYSQKAL